MKYHKINKINPELDQFREYKDRQPFFFLLTVSESHSPSLSSIMFWSWYQWEVWAERSLRSSSLIVDSEEGRFIYVNEFFYKKVSLSGSRLLKEQSREKVEKVSISCQKASSTPRPSMRASLHRPTLMEALFLASIIILFSPLLTIYGHRIF